MKAQLILENGMRFSGTVFGAEKNIVGEVVFTTGMTGYQETLTDPSFAGQIVTMTFPLIGNYGINLEDMEGENLMLMYKGWSTYNDKLRSDLIKNYPGINITDIELYNVDAFNRCENNNGLLLTIKSWESVHPLIKIIPVDWDYKILYGLLYSKEPSDKVKRLIKAVEKLSNNQ